MASPMHYVRALFLDFSSAFNTISHKELMDRLSEMNVDKGLMLILMNFLHNRPQFVQFCNNSSKFTVNSLSPLLFSLYTNYVSGRKNIAVIKYADDTAVLFLAEKNKPITFIQEYLNEFSDWCKKSNLLLNANKTHELYIDFGKNFNNQPFLEINKTTIQQVTEVKYLDVILSHNLKFS